MNISDKCTVWKLIEFLIIGPPLPAQALVDQITRRASTMYPGFQQKNQLVVNGVVQNP